MAGLTFKVRTQGIDTLGVEMAQNAPKVEHVVALQVQKDTEPFVPALTKSLANRTQVKGNLVIYPGPQSRMLYYGKLMVDPDTGSAWAKAGASKVVTDKNLVFTQTVHPQAQSHWFEASKAENLDKWLRVAAKAETRYG